MKKRLPVIVTAVFLLLIGGLFVVHYKAAYALSTDEEKAIGRAKREAELVEVKTIDWFHYLDQFFVIEGTNNKGEQIYCWVPNSQKEKVIVKKVTEGLTKNELMDKVHKLPDLSAEQKPKKILKLKLGMVEDSPAYEVTYIDQSDRYSILYIDFYNGEWYRVYNL